MGKIKINSDLLDIYVKKSDYIELETELQRAKAEIEELKKQLKNNETAYHTELSTYNMECGNLLEANKTLIAENERLKVSERDLSRICQCFKKDIETEKSYTLKYYKALQEIREIANIIYNTNCNYVAESHKIITKINEVIGGIDET